MAQSGDMTETAAIYWNNGKLLGREMATIAVTDLSFTRGYAAFEALRTYGTAPFLLWDHLDRLYNTCAILRLALSMKPEEIFRAVDATLAANRLPESLIRIFVTGGEAQGFLPEGNERTMILVDPLRTYPPSQYTDGVALATSVLRRPLPLAKSTDYVAGVHETMLARELGFDEVVFLDDRSNILEGTTFNVVAVKGRELITPKAGVLRGITVEHVLGLARNAGLEIRREPISPVDTEGADEMFITSSTREIIPISRVGEQIIGCGKPGPITRLLHKSYRQSTISVSDQRAGF